MVVYHGTFSLFIVWKRSDVMPVRSYQRKYRQKTWSLLDVIFKGKILTLDHITFNRVLRYCKVVNDLIADFGCGSGSVVSNIEAKERWCTEVNPIALEYILKTHPDVRSYANLSSLPDNYSV